MCMRTLVFLRDDVISTSERKTEGGCQYCVDCSLLWGAIANPLPIICVCKILEVSVGHCKSTLLCVCAYG